MPYDKQSFLNGLAAGLTATTPTEHENHIITRTSNISPSRFLVTPLTGYDLYFEDDLYRIENPIYVSKLVIKAQYPMSITYICGEKDNPKSETKIIPGSDEEQILYHTYRPPVDYLVNRSSSPNHYLNYVYQIKFIFDNRTRLIHVLANYFDRLTVSGFIIPGLGSNATFGRTNYPGDPKLITTWRGVNYYSYYPNSSRPYYWS